MDKRSLGLFLGIGLELAGLVVFATYAGEWLEQRYSLGGWGTAGMVVLVFIGWLVHLVALLKHVEKQTGEESTDKTKE